MESPCPATGRGFFYGRAKNQAVQKATRPNRSLTLSEDIERKLRAIWKLQKAGERKRAA
jgi:hypothetical protein